MSAGRHTASFRDPAGFVFWRDGVLLRQVNHVFAARFDDFVASGLYDELAGEGLLVQHAPVSLTEAVTPEAHAVLRPERVPFITYPYEWSFSQLKDAALLTLELQRRALRRGFVLRDASAYNVQFMAGRPVFVDTLSFQREDQAVPWAAYGQFCRHFLAPLALMAWTDIRCQQLLRSFSDGVPLDFAAAMLPLRSWLNLGLALHIRAHARAIRRYAHSDVNSVVRAKYRRSGAKDDMVVTLADTITGLRWRPRGSTWARYESEHGYPGHAAQAKAEIVAKWLERACPRLVFDLGANTGVFSRLARRCADLVIALDGDPAAVEIAYLRSRGEPGLLPVLMDLANPSPAQGWAHREFLALEERSRADLVLCLALVHHLVIGNNVPLDDIAEFLSRLGTHAIVEFVPESDTQVQHLLRNRQLRVSYDRALFEDTFARRFVIHEREVLPDSGRVLYRMSRKALTVDL